MSAQPGNIWKRFIGWWTVRKMAGALLIIAVLVGISGFINQHSGLFTPLPLVADFYANVSAELASIAITVLLIDSLYQRHETNQERARLIKQLGSWDNTLAMQAADELQRRGWLQDGSVRNANLIGADLRKVQLNHADLRGVSLHEAKLQFASLSEANLQGASLDGVNLENALLYISVHHEDGHVDYCEANLKGASLRRANLHNAQVRDEQLAKAGALRDATMPDGRRYDGRFNLDREFEWVQSKEIDITNVQEMADFYGVSFEEYERGQKWMWEDLSNQ